MGSGKSSLVSAILGEMEAVKSERDRERRSASMSGERRTSWTWRRKSGEGVRVDRGKEAKVVDAKVEAEESKQVDGEVDGKKHSEGMNGGSEIHAEGKDKAGRVGKEGEEQQALVKDGEGEGERESAVVINGTVSYCSQQVGVRAGRGEGGIVGGASEGDGRGDRLSLTAKEGLWGCAMEGCGVNHADRALSRM